MVEGKEIDGVYPVWCLTATTTAVLAEEGERTD